MSRIGKVPISVPQGVDVAISDGKVTVKGAKGSLYFEVPSVLSVIKENGHLLVKPKSEGNLNKEVMSLWGTYRSHINNAVKGVSQGWQKALELVGVGYTAQLKGKDIVLKVGYSHQVEVPIKEGVSCRVNKNIIELESADKQKVGEMAAIIRRVRPPEPYLGKGIKYKDEVVRRKAGKSGKK